MKEEDSLVTPSYFNPHNSSILADHADTQGNMNEGALEYFVPPCFKSFRFESNLISKVPVCEKFDNNMLPGYQSFTINEIDESNLSLESFPCKKVHNNMQSKIKSCTFMKDKDDLSCLKICDQHMEGSGMLKGIFSKEEEEIRSRFLSSLQPDCSFDDHLGIDSSQIENEAFIDKFSFHSSRHGFSNLNCRNSASILSC